MRVSIAFVSIAFVLLVAGIAGCDSDPFESIERPAGRTPTVPSPASQSCDAPAIATSLATNARALIAPSGCSIALIEGSADDSSFARLVRTKADGSDFRVLASSLRESCPRTLATQRAFVPYKDPFTDPSASKPCAAHAGAVLIYVDATGRLFARAKEGVSEPVLLAGDVSSFDVASDEEHVIVENGKGELWAVHVAGDRPPTPLAADRTALATLATTGAAGDAFFVSVVTTGCAVDDSSSPGCGRMEAVRLADGAKTLLAMRARALGVHASGVVVYDEELGGGLHDVQAIRVSSRSPSPRSLFTWGDAPDQNASSIRAFFDPSGSATVVENPFVFPHQLVAFESPSEDETRVRVLSSLGTADESIVVNDVTAQGALVDILWSRETWFLRFDGSRQLVADTEAFDLNLFTRLRPDAWIAGSNFHSAAVLVDLRRSPSEPRVVFESSAGASVLVPGPRSHEFIACVLTPSTTCALHDVDTLARRPLPAGEPIGFVAHGDAVVMRTGRSLYVAPLPR